MIDIHSHIIFDVDDGPSTLEESISLIKEAYRQGVRHIIATSHRRKGMFETPEDIIANHFNKVKERLVKELPDMTLHYGGELYYSSDVLHNLETKTYPRLAGSRYVLVEFSSGTSWKEIHSALTNLLLLGLTPVVAHIERYNVLEKDKKKVSEMIAMGCYMQINSSSVLKPKLFGDKYKVHKKRAKYFLDNDLVHFVASDMHNTHQRKPYMKTAYELIRQQYGSQRAKDLFNNNPEAILLDELL
ncbi:capsular polysaccharide biosynthesis protein Cps4B [Streptococcus fryi]